jgi:outer membrane protein
MKKTITILAVLLFATAGMASAQTTFKFGHIDSNMLISLMSETDSARIKLQAYQGELEETLQGMQTEYQTKYNTYQQKVSTWTPAVRDSKEKEIQDIMQRIQEFQQNAQSEMQQMQQLYMQPVYTKARAAIEKIAKEGKYTYVFDTSAGALVYMDTAVSTDLLPAAKKELGIPAEKVAPTQIPETGATSAAAPATTKK